MQRVIAFVYDEELESRRALGLDKLDEMWNGVLHMVPPPDTGHGEGEGTLASAIRRLLLPRFPTAFVAENVGLADPARWPKNYRVPDIVVCLDRSNVQPKFVSTADLVVEVRSPNDDTYKKLPFYASRQVSEILIIDRPAASVALLRRRGRRLVAVSPAAKGWLASRLGIEFRWDAPRSILRVRATGGREGASVSISFPRPE